MFHNPDIVNWPQTDAEQHSKSFGVKLCLPNECSINSSYSLALVLLTLKQWTFYLNLLHSEIQEGVLVADTD